MLCALEEDDRLSWVLEANWVHIWRRLGREGEPPGLGPALARLAELALVEVQPLGDKQARYRLHPGVAEAGQAEAGPELQEAVDTELAAYWQAVFSLAVEEEQRGRGGVVVHAARSAVPYLLRRQKWRAAGGQCHPEPKAKDPRLVVRPQVRILPLRSRARMTLRR